MYTEDTPVKFWQGNEACAEGAIAAGCRFFAGYPITPASEIAEIMATRLPKLGGTYIQMEDEIAAISAVIGAAWGGCLAMTATSGPGFSLMQEGIGYAIMTETPCVIVNVQRVGPSTGQATKAAQGDVMQARWGTHGDHESIVLSPYSAQETFELTARAFRISEDFRHPVILLSDEIVAHSRERVVIQSNRDWRVQRRYSKHESDDIGAGSETEGADQISRTYRRGVDTTMPRFGDGLNLLVTGSTHDERGYRKTSDASVHDRLVRRLRSKVVNRTDELTDVVIQGPPRAKWGIVSFGCTGRAVEEAMTMSPKEDLIRSLRLRVVWPFPDSEVRAFSKTVERLLVPEMNLGQIVGEVSRVSCGTVEVVPLGKVGGGRMIEPHEILDIVTE
ncbi:MAG: 2-oxoacid:acceptor oxidoreductase subunit alpha [Candidatus Thorarchaeota archaeon]